MKVLTKDLPSANSTIAPAEPKIKPDVKPDVKPKPKRDPWSPTKPQISPRPKA